MSRPFDIERGVVRVNTNRRDIRSRVVDGHALILHRPAHDVARHVKGCRVHERKRLQAAYVRGWKASGSQTTCGLAAQNVDSFARHVDTDDIKVHCLHEHLFASSLKSDSVNIDRPHHYWIRGNPGEHRLAVD